MIPKLLHYCWFGKQEKPDYVLQCINSWEKYFSDFEIIEWNESNSKLDHPFTINAYKANLWAFVSDYVRVEVLKKFGGIYLDTDMLFVRSLPSEFLSYNAFIGSEDRMHISAGIVGSKKDGEFINKLHSFYNSLGLVEDYREFIIPQIITKKIINPTKEFSKVNLFDDIAIFPPEYFYPLPLEKKKEDWRRYITESTYCVHLWAGSWLKAIGIDEEKKAKENELWSDQVRNTFDQIQTIVPGGKPFILVDEGLFCTQGNIDNLISIPFMEKDGEYWGGPLNDEEAIYEIERQRHTGVSYIVFTSPTFWWLEYYTGMNDYLVQNFELVFSNEYIRVFYLDPKVDVPHIVLTENAPNIGCANSAGDQSPSFKKIIAEFFPIACPFYFIQIGANDGISFDILYDIVYDRKSKGIVVEPLLDYYQKLKENYTYNPNITAVNLAIHPDRKEIDLYRVDPKYLDTLPDWTHGIASVDPFHHLKSNTASEFVVSEKVGAITFDELVNQFYPYSTIDLIQIDVEGFDYEILKQIDLRRYRPKLLKFEHICLSEDHLAKSKRLLEENNYRYFLEAEDIIAHDPTQIIL